MSEFVDKDIRKLARKIARLERDLNAISRARQLSSSTIPIEDEDGVVEVPLGPAVGAGVQAGRVAEEAKTKADQAAEDVLQAALDAAAALSKANQNVAGLVNEYAVGSSQTVPPTGGWSTAVPEWVDGSWIWQRTTTVFASGASETADPVLLTGPAGAPGEKGEDGAPGPAGADGQDGSDGVSVASLTRYFYLGTSAPSVPTVSPPPVPWLPTEPEYTPGSSADLYEVALTTMGDGSWSYGPVSLSSSFAAAKAAYDLADESKFLAQGQYQVIPSETEPTVGVGGIALKQGDQWWEIGTGDDAGKFVGVHVYNGSSWQKLQLVADSVLVPSSVGNVLIADGAIDGETITGAIIRTAATGQRLQLDADGLRGFSSTGELTSAIRPDVGGISIGLAQGGTFRAGDVTPALLDPEYPLTGAFMEVSHGNSLDHRVYSFAGEDESTVYFRQSDRTLGLSLLDLGGGPGALLYSSEDILIQTLKNSIRIQASTINLSASSQVQLNGSPLEPATQAQVDAGADTSRYVTPDTLDGVLGHSDNTDWVDIIIRPGFAAQGPDEVPQVMRRNGVLYLRGLFSNTGISANGTYIVGDFPAGFEPPRNMQVPAGSSTGNAAAQMFLSASGQIQIRTNSTRGAYYGFGAPSWPA